MLNFFDVFGKHIFSKWWFFILIHHAKIPKKNTNKKQKSKTLGGEEYRTYLPPDEGVSVLEEVASNEEIATRCQGLCGCWG